MNVEEFARLHGISESTVRACIAGKSESYPPLVAKRVRKPGSKSSRIYITAEQAADWRSQLPDM